MPFGIEILAETDAEHSGYDLKLAYRSILPNTSLKHAIIADCKGLHNTITT